MKIRLARAEDLPVITEVYIAARAFMFSCGNCVQWSGGYPQEALPRDDIQKNRLYICEDGGQTAAVFMFFIGEEPTYRMIENGVWLFISLTGTVTSQEMKLLVDS